MRCPSCNKKKLRTLETRESAENATRRRKECMACGNRFTTYESIESEPILVVKKDGSKQPFNRDKVVAGLRKACEKRNISETEIEEMTNKVVKKVRSLGKSNVRSTKIGLYIVNMLKKVDKVAYLRFASVYRDFEDIGHFEKEITKLQK